MKFKTFRTYLTNTFCVFLVIGSVYSQSAPSILSTNIDELSDSQIAQYWQQAKDQGYTIEQVKSLALARGASPTQIASFEQRVAALGAGANSLGGAQIDNVLEISDGTPAGIVGDAVAQEAKTDPLFGFDFFNNPNITFTPNLNLATPANYQVGPGDEFVINIWGAAENVYNVSVDREGAIRIPNVGPVFVSGMPMDKATSKVVSTLSRVYAGINAPQNSPYKIFADISLVKVRTVQVNIIGEVKVPGTYSLSALSTVLNALYASGGPTKSGTFRKIKLVRNGDEVSYFDVYKYLLEGSQQGNLTLKDQDVIIVAPYESRISLSGAIKRPGIFEILPSETLADLMRYASGFKSNAFKDRIVLERIEGDRRVVKELLYANAQNSSLKDGDDINVGAIIDKFENRIEIEGAVYRPGAYEYVEGLTLKGLIEKAAGTKETAFLDRGLIFRTEDGVSKEAKSFSVSKVLNGTEIIALKPNDKVRIFDLYNLKEDKFLYVDGAVKNPTSIPFVDNMDIEDLVIMAGGFKDGANTEVIDVFRQIQDDNFETLSESFKVSANGSLNMDDGSPFVLMPNDRVSVRSLRGFSDQIRVGVEGEANFPGMYSIANKDEKISDLVERAGGLSQYAFVEGATLIRKNPYYKDDALNMTEGALNDEGVENIKLNNQSEFRVGINLNDILTENGKMSKHNLVLKSGDRLVIPSVKETVKVEGEILLPSLVRYDSGNTLKDYINKSGGFSMKSKRGKTYVVYANGDIASTKNFLFFRSYPKIRPGALILVPTKLENPNKIGVQEVVSIGTGVTAIALLIDRLLR